MPLVESMYNIIYEEASPESIIDDLLNNPHEVDVELSLIHISEPTRPY